MKSTRHWEHRADGSLMTGPVLGWEAGVALSFGLVRLRYANSPEQEKQGGLVAQFGLTAFQARQLAGDLLQMAEMIEGQIDPQSTKQ